MTALAPGEVAPADVVAPFDLTVEDGEETARKRAEAEAAVLPVYTYDANVFANTEDKIRALFAEGRAWTARFPRTTRAGRSGRFSSTSTASTSRSPTFRPSSG